MNEVRFSYSKHSWHVESPRTGLGEPCVVTRATLQLGWAGRSQLQVQTNLCGGWGVQVQPCSSTSVWGKCWTAFVCMFCMWIPSGLDAKCSETVYWESDLFWDVCCVIPAQNCFWSRDTSTQMQNLDVSSIMNIMISLLFQSVLNYFF